MSEEQSSHFREGEPIKLSSLSRDSFKQLTDAVRSSKDPSSVCEALEIGLGSLRSTDLEEKKKGLQLVMQALDSETQKVDGMFCDALKTESDVWFLENPKTSEEKEFQSTLNSCMKSWRTIYRDLLAQNSGSSSKKASFDLLSLMKKKDEEFQPSFLKTDMAKSSLKNESSSQKEIGSQRKVNKILSYGEDDQRNFKTPAEKLTKEKLRYDAELEDFNWNQSSGNRVTFGIHKPEEAKGYGAEEKLVMGSIDNFLAQLKSNQLSKEDKMTASSKYEPIAKKRTETSNDFGLRSQAFEKPKFTKSEANHENVELRQQAERLSSRMIELEKEIQSRRPQNYDSNSSSDFNYQDAFKNISIIAPSQATSGVKGSRCDPIRDNFSIPDIRGSSLSTIHETSQMSSSAQKTMKENEYLKQLNKEYEKYIEQLQLELSKEKKTKEETLSNMQKLQ